MAWDQWLLLQADRDMERGHAALGGELDAAALDSWAASRVVPLGLTINEHHLTHLM